MNNETRGTAGRYEDVPTDVLQQTRADVHSQLSKELGANERGEAATESIEHLRSDIRMIDRELRGRGDNHGN